MTETDPLAEELTDFLVDDFIEQQGGLITKIPHQTSNKQITITVSGKDFTCPRGTTKEMLTKNLKEAFGNILAIGGIPEIVNGILDIDTHFVVNLVTKH